MNLTAVAKITGLSPHTIRAWQARYQAVTPRRTAGGRRIYAVADVERLKVLAGLVRAGVAIGSIASASDEELRRTVEALAGSGGRDVPERNELAGRLLDAVARFDLERISTLLQVARVELPVVGFVLDVLAPAFTQVGIMVANGRMSIAQEHAFSALVRNEIGDLMQRSLKVAAFLPGLSIALCTPEGNLHEFGILLSWVLCGVYGIKSHYLGANLPAEALGSAAAILQPTVVLLGNTAAKATPHFRRYLAATSKALPGNVELWVGGAVPAVGHRPCAIRHFPTLESLADCLRAHRLAWGGAEQGVSP